MAFDKGMAGLEFINEIGAKVGAKGSISEIFADEDDSDLDEENQEGSVIDKASQKGRRLAEETQIGFDLSQYMAFDLRRGDEDSAPAAELNFEVLIDSLEGDNLNFKMKFDNP